MIQIMQILEIRFSAELKGIISKLIFAENEDRNCTHQFHLKTLAQVYEGGLAECCWKHIYFEIWYSVPFRFFQNHEKMMNLYFRGVWNSNA